MNRVLSVMRLKKNFRSFANLSKTADMQNSKEFSVTQMDDIIAKMPKNIVQKFRKDILEQTCKTFFNEGFETIHLINIFGKRPQLLRLSPEKLLQSLECLRETRFGDRNIIIWIEQHPELLEYTDVVTLRKSYANIRTYAGNEKNIFRLFLSSPNILTDMHTLTDSKINYFKSNMKVDVTDVAKSSVFTLSLDVIKCRHVFLTRLGLFKPRSVKASALEPNKNPKMREIYDTTDKEFAFKTCGVTIEEFETFQELYKRELENSNENEEEDDDDER